MFTVYTNVIMREMGAKRNRGGLPVDHRGYGHHHSLLFHVMGALAQFERRLNAERSRAGIEAARKRGKHLGRPADLTPEKIRHARQMIRRSTARNNRFAASVPRGPCGQSRSQAPRHTPQLRFTVVNSSVIHLSPQADVNLNKN
jgi:hypothetical protein